MKNIFLFGLLVFGFTANAQSVLQQANTFAMPVLPSGISLPSQTYIGKSTTAINASLQYYALNYRKVFYTDSFFDADNKDQFADFYDTYSYAYRNTAVYNITPMIKNMPQPGPNLDYFNVDRSSGGLYDKVVTK